ncbi:hypothetical protein KC949_01615 [Candidatus Saccharibacteria bacterium]|jgi:hypothetical protein|nr:hypothetical protein [Candidatus Saccharibacteria bacterium]
MKHSVERVVTAIQAGWSSETSASPDEWNDENPALGQCVPSSLVAQDMLGGQLERLATIRDGKRETHYRNVLMGSKVLDVSRGQYPDDQVFEPAPVDSDVREYVMQSESTRKRYELLLSRVVLALADA